MNIRPVELEPAVRGDRNIIRNVALGGITDLTAATDVEAHVWKRGTAPVTLAAAITDDAARAVAINLGADETGWLADVATAGKYYVEVQIDFADGTRETWPTRTDEAGALATSQCTITIREQGG